MKSNFKIQKKYSAINKTLNNSNLQTDECFIQNIDVKTEDTNYYYENSF